MLEEIPKVLWESHQHVCDNKEWGFVRKFIMDVKLSFIET